MASSPDRAIEHAIAIVGVGAILPDAPTAPAFWDNIANKRYSIIEVPPDRWSIADYYDPDPTAPDKTYSKIGGFVRGFEFDWKRYKIPPRVAAAMDPGQQWAVTIATQALEDYGYPNRPLDTERTGVVLGTAMGGELHYQNHLRIMFPEYVHALEKAPAFQALPQATREAMVEGMHNEIVTSIPSITEDTMPGELPNIVSGRVANVLNLRGPNFIADAACAGTLAAIDAACDLLNQHHCDAVICGGVDRNMGVNTFVKFCKIGALSNTGTRPFGDGADGFVMGEGSASFLLKRLADAERDGDKIYAVIRGVGGSSDGRGKGITAPNPIGQQLAAIRAWQDAGLDPATATLIEAHGTSTKVGDVVEVESLSSVFGGAPKQSIALGSAKSNIGHLKAGAGAAGLLKATMAVYHKKLPPTLNAETPNPNINFAATPFFVNHNLQDWPEPKNFPRRAGVSAYGFGGTNFHVVLEEHVPGLLEKTRQYYQSASVTPAAGAAESQPKPAESVAAPMANRPSATASLPPLQGLPPAPTAPTGKASNGRPPVRGILALGARDAVELKDKLDEVFQRVREGYTPPLRVAPDLADVSAQERLVIDFGSHDELLERLEKARKAAGFDNPAAWKALSNQGIFRGSGPKPGKIAFLFPGQGSQFTNMGRELVALEPVFAETFKEADAVMTPILGRPLTSYIFIDSQDPSAVRQAEYDLMQTAITQPAMLTMDEAFRRLLAEYGFEPDMVMGHSLGEYAALTAAGIMPFAESLEASAARGSEMTKVSWGDNGWMAAVMAPIDVIEATINSVDGYVVLANINSTNQSVIGGESKAVEKAIELFQQKGYQAIRIPVSHAFHTRLVAPASGPLRQVLDRLHISEPKLPLVGNVTGDLYPTDVTEIKDILQQQIAATVQWVKGLETLYREGARTFVEVGPKKALKGFVDDVVGKKPNVVSLFTNHPKQGELPTFNQALCGLYAAGYAMQDSQPTATGNGRPSVSASANGPVRTEVDAPAPEQARPVAVAAPIPPTPVAPAASVPPAPPAAPVAPAASADALQILSLALAQMSSGATARKPYDRNDVPVGSVVVSGTGLGLPGANKPVMDPDNALRILRGEQFVDLIPERFRKLMLKKRITRLVKSEDGSGSFETITDPGEVIKLAGRGGPFDLTEEYGVSAKLVEALDRTTQLAMAAGLDALREAGIPLAQTYRPTSTGKYLPEKWLLPESMRDETGVVFASAFPGGDRFADELTRYHTWVNRMDQLEMLEDLRLYTQDDAALREIERRVAEIRESLEREPYEFDRRFIFRILAMGHSQFAEFIGARGPNTHVNAACASTAQGIALAEDWIRSGRCRRVIVVGADDVTSENLMEWIGAGFLSTGAAATDDRVEEAALPFDRRRHGTLLGMGACALVVESEDAVRERGMRGIVELLSSETDNSAYHGTRLDVSHIGLVMERLVYAAERRFGTDRYSMAPQMVFMSHETFTPARGGSASSEVMALRQTFGDAANQIIMANTKGFTGHPMGVGIEDVIAVKILEYGIVPPVPNFKEVDPDLGPLTLSRGGRYPVQYALHLAAGFGSQISMTLTRRIPGSLDRVDNPALYNYWLSMQSGYDRAETEVVKRVLRIQAQGFPPRQPAPSTWQYGTGPSVRAAAPGDSAGAGFRPLPMAIPAQTARPAAPPAPPAPQPRPQQAAPAPAPRVEPAAPPPPTPAPAPAAAAPAPRPAPAPAPAAPAPAPAAPTPAPAPAAPAAPPVDPVVEKVLKVVAEKTGYPPDMLDVDLDLEADLGIDTVKQAETFAAIREAFDIPRVENLRLRDFPTIASVVGFVRTNRPDLAVTAAPAPAPAAPAAAPAPTAAPAPAAASGVDPVTAKVLLVVAEKTGYPSDMLDVDLDLEADLGIDTVKQAETFAAIREAFDIPRVENLRLRDFPTIASVVGFVLTNRPDLKTAAVAPAPAPPPSAAPAPAAPAPAPAATAAPAGDMVTEKVLEVVAEKTGYPKDMLDVDLDLEADLGIDTVKQAETFAAIREAFDIPRVENLRLRDFPTIASVVGFVLTNRPDLAVAAAPAPAPAAAPAPAPVAPAPAPAPAPSADPVAERVMAVVADKTGYPQEMLDPELDLEADLGIDTVKQAETFAAIREAFDIPRVENLKLRDYPTLGSVIRFVYDNRPDLKSAAPAAPAAPAAATPAPVAPAAAPAPVAAPPAPAPALAPAAPAAAPAGRDAVTATVMAVVADKTGYPEEMLDMDSDLEADLGIDTVKQAETFAAIREAFDIPRIENLKLRDYPTLGSVVQFVYDQRPDLKSAASAPAPAAAPADRDAVTATVMAVVADKTGYPEEMLDMDSDLEADLGIDTVKQAETFAAIREAFDIPRIENLKLRDYPTLGSVVQFVYDQRPDLKSAAAAPAAPAVAAPAPAAPAAAPAPAKPKVTTIGTLEDADKMPRRVPVPSLRPTIEFSKPTGVVLNEASRVVVMLDQGGVGKALVNRLQKRGVNVLTLDPGVATDALDAHLKAWLAEGPIQGLYWLPALDVEPNLEELDLAAWRENIRVRIKNLYTAARALYDALGGPNHFLVSATRLGGLHGYSPEGATAPMGGSVVGFTKAFNIEQSMREEGKGTTVKAVDFEVSRKTADPADQLIAETLFDPGVVEVGYYDGLRYTVTLIEKPAKDGQPGMVLGPDSVFVVTGAAGGITSAIVTDLAANSQGIFYLLDLVPAPARNDENVALYRTDKEALKRKLIEDAKARGERPTPATIDKQIMGIERSEAALRAVEAVEAAGGTAYYYALDLRDGDAVTKVVDDIRERHGRIDVLLHAGGLLIDRTLPNKEPSQFDLVFDVKADGFFSLIRAAKGMPIGATVSFSSVAGRFGNNGQSDYSSANDLLCKISSSMRTWRPETRGIAIDWTAWGQIGMASRGSVPKIMEALGIDMLPAEAGVPTIRRELTYGGTRGEILVAGRLGVWLEERDPNGGADVDKINETLAKRDPKLLMIGEVKAVKLYGGLQVETTFDPKEQPFLFDHQINEVPVLPGVMGTESFAELASLLAPGYTVAAVENESFGSPFKFHRHQPRTLYLEARIEPAANGELLAYTTLKSVTRPKPELPAQVTVHFTANVRLTREELPKPSGETPTLNPEGRGLDKEEIYKTYFHGPAYQVLERVEVQPDKAIGLMVHGLPSNSAPDDVASLVAPRLIEFCFQTAGMWEMVARDTLALPEAIGTVTAYRQPAEAEGRRLYAVVTPVSDGEAFDAHVIDDAGNVYVEMRGYRTVKLPSGMTLK